MPTLCTFAGKRGNKTVITDAARIIFDGNTWVVLEISKSCLVVLTRAEFVAALKRGKAWRRSAAMKGRLGTQGES